MERSLRDEEPERRLERDAEQMKEQSERVGDQIEDARGDWEAKERDSSVPGAQPAEDDDAEGGHETDPDAQEEAGQ